MNILSLFILLSLCLLFVMGGLFYLRKHRKKVQYPVSAIVQENPSPSNCIKSVQSGETAKEVSSDMETERIALLYQRLCKLMEDEQPYLQRNLQRDELARRLNTNRTYLSKAITRFSGKGSVTDYINSYRLQYAAELLLKEPDMSISKIELQSGFSSRETFNRTFKIQYGMTPRAFRQHHSAMD